MLQHYTMLSSSLIIFTEMVSQFPVIFFLCLFYCTSSNFYSSKWESEQQFSASGKSAARSYLNHTSLHQIVSQLVQTISNVSRLCPTCQETILCNAHQWPDMKHPSKMPFPIQWMVPWQSTPKEHLNRLSCFWRTDGHDQQTDRHANRQRVQQQAARIQLLAWCGLKSDN